MSVDETSSTGAAADIPIGWDDPERELTSSVSLFEGDEGGLELSQRRVLVALLKQRFITAQSHPKEWKTLTANPRLIRSRLNDLFLNLHLDADREVAYKRPVVPEGGGRFPTLLHDTAWSREETILLVYLRTRSRSEEAAGTSRTYVDRQDILEHIASLRPAHATDHAADGRRAAKAIESLNRAGLLIGASISDRFEVSPAIDVVLPLERLQDLLRWLKAQPAGTTSANGVASPVDGSSEAEAIDASTEHLSTDEDAP
ncbi:DUF4194 domain-containing protein [Micromonospora sp. 4G55]|uniref:DUF4194 domain-containing protein n=1 Tax=Micromonospora sp. 4G55 TaxID=2806102 RepID=UPI001A4C156C|nr:DUF4194 domain-containing protein [Micromonospora sp. 4G55]MBM0255556.1 DUF4194 domain-containing protein [Micromonospora sp. 4G55]